ncbi:transcription termination factor 1, mitochondrial [Mugil cephalus]|uniref:transcription termination factor 1, mitochondrial n=1 Tax=Mugil cephalus TaxID=48193 RepID=UPI001FB69B9E|nr:transcription termination factor 1, mitochondrial [Mugil cephalus]XP_047461169.1 transcription termination factor 1, mitochondrial [Mugil cephalus]
MAAVAGVRTLLGLHRSGTFQRSFGLVPVQLALACLPRRLSIASASDNEPKSPPNPENESLLKNLNLMGVDVKMVRQRQPGVLRKPITNERDVAQFLLGKGATNKEIASIITRYPRAIIRSHVQLEQRWTLWRKIFKTDAEIVSILARSPESFFRTSDNENLEKNIDFLISLGLDVKDLHRLLTAAPRTFSNSVALNRQMLEFLEDICVEFGGTNPEEFAKSIILKNLYILIRSTKRVRANIDYLKASLKLNDAEMLDLLQGNGSEILDLATDYIKKNFNSLQQKMVSHGCHKNAIIKVVISYPMILYIGSETLKTKIDCLLKGRITMQQILEKPRVLDYSTLNITGRLEILHKMGYDFQKNGINILDCSKKRFDLKIEKLGAK